MTGLVSGLKLHDFNCGLKAYRREVVRSLSVYGEMHRYLPVMAHVMGGLGGYLFGVAFLRNVRREAIYLQDEFDRHAFERRFK